MNYMTHTCPSGLRLIHLQSSSKVVFCGFAVKAGSRNEAEGEEGLAHFCEHMTFKGTKRRSSVQIINAIEGVGGELNAFTNKEDTVFYSSITRDHFRQAVDVLTDIVFNSQFPQSEIEKEREVVCDEIESYEDTPSELIFDDFDNILFQGHPLGHNILGYSEHVRKYNSDDARRFTQRYYRPDNSIFFSSGDIDFKKLVAWMEKAPIPTEKADKDALLNKSNSQDTVKVNDESRTIVRNRSTHQAHVMIGAIAYASTDSRRWALYLLNNMLGGPSMNSRLNLSLRERNGLVYTVESNTANYSDTGSWSVYFGCDSHDVNRCCQLVRRELDKFVNTQLSDAQLKKAKQQLHGQLAIASDNREQFAIDFARNFLHYGTERNLADILRHIDSITKEELQQVALQLFNPSRMTILIYK